MEKWNAWSFISSLSSVLWSLFKRNLVDYHLLNTLKQRIFGSVPVWPCWSPLFEGYFFTLNGDFHLLLDNFSGFLWAKPLHIIVIYIWVKFQSARIISEKNRNFQCLYCGPWLRWPEHALNCTWRGSAGGALHMEISSKSR